MSGFPLFNLNSNNLDKVFNKLKENSYYRMQQTCRGVGEFIRKSPNVSVHIDRAFSTRWDSKKSCYIFERYYGDLKRCDNIEALYGTNVSSIIDVGYDGDVDRLCVALAKNRITCVKVTLNNYKWSKADCVKILNTVKASMVDMASEGGERFEVVFSSKYLKKVEFMIDAEDDFAEMAPEVLLKFEEVKFRVAEANAFDLLDKFLENILLETLDLAKLKSFKVESEWDRSDSKDESIKMVFDEHNLKIASKAQKKDELTYTVQLPRRFPPTANLTIVIKKVYTIIAISITYQA